MRNIDFIVDNTNICSALFCKIAAEYRGVDCENIYCDNCEQETLEWLLKERITDWERVKLFHPVKVRNYKDEEWEYGYYFIDERFADSNHYFIASNTKNPKDPGFDFSIFNECELA